MLDSRTARSVIDHAVGLGADFVDLFVERNRVNDISTLSGEVQDIGSGIDFGVGVRLVYGGQGALWIHQPTGAGEIERIVSDLAAKDRRDPATTARSFDFRDTPDIHAARRTLARDPETESKVTWLLAADRSARAASNLISQARGSCVQREQAVEVFNSEGLHLRDTRHYTRVRLTAIAADGSEQATGTATEGALKGWENRGSGRRRRGRGGGGAPGARQSLREALSLRPHAGGDRKTASAA